MARDIRIFRMGAVYHVTNKTYRGELRLSPDEFIELFAAGCLAKAASMYGVRIMTFVVMGNHFHLVLQAPLANLDDFMEYFQRELSTRLNRYRGTSGTNFPERYDAEEIASAEDFCDLAAHILCNPVRARLVYEAAEWPGVSSLALHRAGETSRTVRHATRAQAAAMREHGLTPALERSLETLELELSPPPFWEGLDDDEIQRRIAEAVDAEEARLQDEIDRMNERTRGRNRILDESHCQRPKEVFWRARGRCISRDADWKAAYNVWFDETTQVYRRAATKWRMAGAWGEYPPGTFPPGWLRCLTPSDAVGPPLPWHEPRPMAA
ncbi:MAG: transposase [Myxococcota bacterium]